MAYSPKIITASAFLSLGLMGTAFSFLGASLPVLRSFLDLDIESAGLLTVSFQIGYAVNSFVGGLLSDLIRRERVIIAGCFFLGAASIVIAFWDNFGISLFLVLLMGVGAGLILTGSNALLVGLYPDRKTSILNVHHVFFGVGSFVGPLIMSQLLKHEGLWKFGYRGMGVALILLIFLFLTAGPTAQVRTSGPAITKYFGDLIRRSAFRKLVLISTLAIGTEFGLMFLSVTFLHEGKNLPVVSAGYVLSLYFVGLIVGRMVCGWFTVRHPATYVLFGLLCLLVISVTTAWLAGGVLSAAAIVACGLACSGMFPCLLGLAGTLFHKEAGTALGIISTMNGVGGTVVCWIIGMVSQRVSVQFGFIVLVVSSFCALTLFSLQMRSFSRAEIGCMAGGAERRI